MNRAEPATVFRDHYTVLGVDVDAGDAEIKAAFWELAKRHHPDLNQGDLRAARRFAEISQAKSVLLSRPRRAAFDREREAFLRTGVPVPVEQVEPVPPPRFAGPGRALLLTGLATALLAVLVLPLASLPARPEPTPVRGFDAGVIGGVAGCAACLLLTGLSWPAWRRALSPGRWEAMVGFLVLWLGLALAGHLDPHVLLGGLFSSDLAPASGGDALVVGVVLMLGGAVLLRPGSRRRAREG
jgi:hypothetical protein